MTKVEIIYSPILDTHIKQDLVNSPMWKECYAEDEDKPNTTLFKYVIKFIDLTPVQLIKSIERV